MREISIIKQRILQFIEYKSISKYEFYKKTGVSNGVLSQYSGISEENTLKFLSYYTEVNPTWLLTGRGEMLLTGPVDNVYKTASIKNHEVNEHIEPYIKPKGAPLIPVECMAGYSTGDVQVHEINENIHVPDFEQKGVKYFIRVSGSSMQPKYNNGDVLACRPITDTSFFQWGKVYVLDTEQGPLVNRLFTDQKNEDCLVCKSDNEAYPPFSIPKISIRSDAIAVGVIRLE